MKIWSFLLKLDGLRSIITSSSATYSFYTFSSGSFIFLGVYSFVATTAVGGLVSSKCLYLFFFRLSINSVAFCALSFPSKISFVILNLPVSYSSQPKLTVILERKSPYTYCYYTFFNLFFSSEISSTFASALAATGILISSSSRSIISSFSLKYKLTFLFCFITFYESWMNYSTYFFSMYFSFRDLILSICFCLSLFTSCF